jgi:hypothetical protein
MSKGSSSLDNKKKREEEKEKSETTKNEELLVPLSDAQNPRASPEEAAQVLAEQAKLKEEPPGESEQLPRKQDKGGKSMQYFEDEKKPASKPDQPKPDSNTPKKPDVRDEEIVVPETNIKIEVEDVMKGVKVRGAKRMVMEDTARQMLDESNLPNAATAFSPKQPTYPWLWKSADAFGHDLEYLEISEYHQTVRYQVKNEFIKGPWTNHTAFSTDMLYSGSDLLHRLVGVTNEFKREKRIEYGSNVIVGVVKQPFQEPAFREKIDRNPALRAIWDRRRVDPNREIVELGRFALGAGGPGDRVTAKLYAFNTGLEIDEIYRPLATLTEQHIIVNYIKTPLQARAIVDNFRTQFHRPIVSRDVRANKFYVIGPRVGAASFEAIGRESPTFVNKVFDMTMSATNLITIGQSEKFPENQEITKEVATRVNEIQPTNNIGTQITSVRSDRVFKTLVAAGVMDGGTIIRFPIAKPEVRNPITLLGCFSYVTLTPDNLIDLGDAQNALQYIFRHHYANHYSPNGGRTYIPYEEDVFNAPFPAARGNLLDFNVAAFVGAGAPRGSIANQTGNYAAAFPLWAAGGAYEQFFNMFAAGGGTFEPLNGYPPPVGFQQFVNGVAQFYPYRALNYPGGIGVAQPSPKFVGRWNLLVNYLRATRVHDLRLDDNSESRMYRGMLRLFLNRGIVPSNFMREYTVVTNTLRPLRLRIGPVAQPIELEVKPYDMMALMYTVDLKSIYIGTGIYEFALWSNAFKADLELYISASSLVRQRYAHLRSGAERRAILKELLLRLDDFFTVPESRACFEFLNLEFRPPFNAGGGPVFTHIVIDALVECEQRLYDALPRFGYTSRLSYEAPLANNAVINAIKAQVAAGGPPLTFITSGLDYVTVSNDMAVIAAGGPTIQYHRQNLALRVVDMNARGVIFQHFVGGNGTNAFAVNSLNYPWIKLNIKFDSLSESYEVNDPEMTIMEKLKNYEAINFTIRVRDLDVIPGLIRRIRARGLTFMPELEDFLPMWNELNRFERGAGVPGSQLIPAANVAVRVFDFDPSDKISTFEIQDLDAPYK